MDCIKINRNGLLALQVELEKINKIFQVEDYNYYLCISDAECVEKRKDLTFCQAVDVTHSDECLASGNIKNIGWKGETYCPRCGHTPFDPKNPHLHRIGDAYDPFAVSTRCYGK